MILRLTAFLITAMPALADSVVPTRTLRPNTIISDTDVTLRADLHTGGYDRLEDVIGQETRVALYPGRPFGVDDIGPPAVVSRNQLVRLSFQSNGLAIATEGRALERGAIGDRIRIMNLSSRTTLTGLVRADGSIDVSP